MKHYNMEHPEINEAILDLQKLLLPFRNNVDKVMLFGSTLQIPIEEAKDIDFFISYKNMDFENMRNNILKNQKERRIAVENLEARYSNCPIWDQVRPLTLHIILYREGISKFSEKLLNTKKKAVDVTNMIFT